MSTSKYVFAKFKALGRNHLKIFYVGMLSTLMRCSQVDNARIS